MTSPGRTNTTLLLWGLVSAGTVIRILLAASIPLFDDEAYYWLWSKAIAGSYLDHPPFIAYLIRFGTILGEEPLWIRLGPLVVGAATTLVLFALGREMFGERAGLVAAAAYQVTPVLAGAGFLATPDTPLFLWWTLALLWGWRALHRHPRWWLAAGIAIGCAMLSKLSTLLLVLGIVAFALTRRPVAFRAPAAYAGAALAVAVFSPVLVWNATHDWANADFVLRHRVWEQPRGLPGLVTMATEQLGLALFLFFVFVWAAGAALRRWGDDRYAFLLWTSLPPVLFMLFVAYFQGSAHGVWAGSAYLGLAVVLGGLRTGRAALAAFAANALLLLYVVFALWVPQIPAPPGTTEELYGWPEVARHVEALASQLPPPVIVAVDRYKYAAQLAYHTRRQIPVVFLPAPHKHSIWPAPAEVASASAVWILEAGAEQWVKPEAFYAAVQELPPLVVEVRGRAARTFRIWAATGRTR